MFKFMNWIDACIFRDAGDGRTIIFPWGVFGRAYTTASETLKDRIRNLHLFSLMLVPVTVLLSSQMSILMILPLLGAHTIIYFGTMKYVLANATDLVPMPKRDSAAALVTKFPKPYIVIGLIGCLMFVLLGTLMIVTGNGEERLAGIFATVVFSAFGAGYGWLLFTKRRVEGGAGKVPLTPQ